MTVAPDDRASRQLTHLTPSGEARMVDVSQKLQSFREAVAEALLEMASTTADLVFGGGLEKGDALATARLAAIMAAKRTPDLIPLCHPLPLSGVEVHIERNDTGARIEAIVRTTAATGVEMEAMTAAAVGALALYDMVKGVERGISLGPVRLLRKSGGSSGEWTR